MGVIFVCDLLLIVIVLFKVRVVVYVCCFGDYLVYTGLLRWFVLLCGWVKFDFSFFVWWCLVDDLFV